MVLMDEVRQGYPHHVWLAIGNLNEAARECCVQYPELAKKIRGERLKLEKNHRHLIPFFSLIEEATRLASNRRK